MLLFDWSQPRARSWPGKDRDTTAYFPRARDTGDNRYRLGAAVTCEWTRFRRVARHDDGDVALRRALALVRGRPAHRHHPQRYAWAEPAFQEMVSAIVDVAHELSCRPCEAGDLWPARQGLLGCSRRYGLSAPRRSGRPGSRVGGLART
ncbi:hypothetical protein ABZS81_28120 [Streptomyces sp. NPDC005318]|uniref:hypothetical protein n=1 Tax=Streptomyces sp. NPDC005318 TaxID=3157031 RepID=UPI0033B19FE8